MSHEKYIGTFSNQLKIHILRCVYARRVLVVAVWILYCIITCISCFLCCILKIKYSLCLLLIVVVRLKYSYRFYFTFYGFWHNVSLMFSFHFHSICTLSSATLFACLLASLMHVSIAVYKLWRMNCKKLEQKIFSV